MSQTENRKMIDPELDWLAFRYIAGELTAAERAAFESRLADDLAACEAVAAAVAMADGILAAQRPLVVPVSKPAGRSRFTRHAGWLAGAAALSLLAILAIFAGRDGVSPSDDQTQLASAGDLPPTVLAETWNATRIAIHQGPDAQGPDAVQPIEANSVAEAEAEPVASDDAAATDEAAAPDGGEGLTAPEWLLAAVAASQEKPASEPASESSNPTDG